MLDFERMAQRTENAALITARLKAVFAFMADEYQRLGYVGDDDSLTAEDAARFRRDYLEPALRECEGGARRRP